VRCPGDHRTERFSPDGRLFRAHDREIIEGS